VIIVAGKEDIDYCYKEIVKKNNINKATKIVEGGEQRYDSVCKGLQAIEDVADYVLIHDGARPCIDIDTINGTIECVKKHKACIVAVGAKDTIKIVKDGKIVDSPDRKTMWQAQTPQAFSYKEIKEAYKKVIGLGEEVLKTITDDASVWSKYREEPVFVYEGKYTNLKITTKEDMKIAENYLKNR
jgi:2-C-methyl-D-erythritol 4-phosphate cytidylyltransferase